MQNKPDDEPYCGVSISSIKKASPEINWENMYHFLKFIKTRYRVHYYKDELKLPAPWTKNAVISKYRFTNVRREHDYQTKRLIELVSTNPDLSLGEKIVNTFMFRAWNNADTFEFFGFPRCLSEVYSEGLKENVRDMYNLTKELDPERKWWSSAYNQGGTKAAWKFPAGDGYQRAYKESDARLHADWEKEIPLRPFHIGPWLKKQRIAGRLIAAENQEEAFNIIKQVRGFADFLAYQVFVDLTYIPEYKFSENEFVIAGPGCKKGLDYLFYDTAGMTTSECIFWLRDNYDGLLDQVMGINNAWDCRDDFDPKVFMKDLPKEDRVMNVMSLENCLCEISKYIRAVTDTGGPRNKYKPRKET